MIRVLLYSQDLGLHSLLAPTLGSEFSLFLERRMDRIREMIARDQCDVIILDLDCNRFPIPQQLVFFDEVRDLGVPVVVMADDDCRPVVLDLVQRRVYDYVRKPPALPELKIVVRRAFEHAALKRELELIRQRTEPTRCDQMIGGSVRVRVVYDLIARVANLDASILITGESGTGKELIARAIHNLSLRKERPFVAVSCGAIPETLIEAELFGAEKGAFTGSAVRRRGYFEEADDGTLFFDEVGEFSAHTQVRLLRVLQEREFSRLGANQLIPLRARLLFATHRNLVEMVKEGTFREDLYYRINVMTIRAPALREHNEDVPQLAEHFLREYSRAYRRPANRITPSAMALLVQHDWPGNVRELQNVIQRAVILNDDYAVHSSDLPPNLQHAAPFALDTIPGSSFESLMLDYKTKLALKAVEDCNGNKTLAARSLNISRTYLHRLIKDPEPLDPDCEDPTLPELRDLPEIPRKLR